jgi:2-polyprenyl-3-methyl-5-hydroxy-6-metoxy-1,4-benzoquinol methylase
MLCGEEPRSTTVACIREAVRLRCRSCGRAKLADAEVWRCDCGAAVTCHQGVWRFDSFEPVGFAPQTRARLAGFEEHHFWFEAREQLVLAQLERHALAPGSVLDLGCGNGRLLAALATRGAATTGVDAYPDSLARARARAPKATLLQADILDVPLESGGFDLVTALDVLEHVAPGAFFDEARRLLAPQGHLLLSVPAFRCLWSQRDVAAGHRKRYQRADLAAELAVHGFEVLSATHYQFLLFPLLWLSRRLDASRDRPLERSPPALLRRLLGWINQQEVRWWGRKSLPWGSSLMVVARPHEGPAR